MSDSVLLLTHISRVIKALSCGPQVVSETPLKGKHWVGKVLSHQ